MIISGSSSVRAVTQYAVSQKKMFVDAFEPAPVTNARLVLGGAKGSVAVVRSSSSIDTTPA